MSKFLDSKFPDSGYPIPQEVDSIEELGNFLNKKNRVEVSSRDNIFLRSLYKLFINSSIDEIKNDNKWLYKNMCKVSSRQKYFPKKLFLLTAYRRLVRDREIKPNEHFYKLLRNKAMRSQSGVIVVTVVMAPHEMGSCKYDCYYCPNDSTIARSYLLSEPAVMRGAVEEWIPARQLWSRLCMYYENGHPIDKIELIILGGTFSNYAKEYCDYFIKELYYAANVFNYDIMGYKNFKNYKLMVEKTRQSKTLQEEIKLNESAECSIIGLTIETRPDCINISEAKRFRNYGCTRVQIGIQHLDNNILDKVNRRCKTKHTIKAIELLKWLGFKVDGHFMPDLPGSNYEIDKNMFEYLFSERNQDIQCDQVKIYPTMTLDYTKILEWYKEGIYKPYADTNPDKMLNLLCWISENCPHWIRINRIIRDFDIKYINAGIKDLGIRSRIQKIIKNPSDIRGREIKDKIIDIDDSKIHIDEYVNANGVDYFIEYGSKDRKKIYGFLRLRKNFKIPELENKYYSKPKLESDFDLTFMKGACFIRELHVYGQVVEKSESGIHQHIGIGKLLMKTAESMCIGQRVIIIAGVGVRNYYRKLGYKLHNTYMIKEVNENNIVSSPLLDDIN